MLKLFIILLFFVSNYHGRVLNDVEKIEAVKMHNLLRRSVVPQASNMNELEYSDEIASISSEYLDKCQFSHMYGPQGYGENGRLSTDNNITKSILNWFQERIYYDWNKSYGKRCYIRNEEDNFLPSPICGHYTMLATHSITKVGCAIKFCPTITIPNENSINDAYLTFCFYNKGPQDHPYTVGKPCTGCDDMSYQYCNDGLCVKKSNLKNECKVVCKRCQNFPTFIPGFCGCDCEVGNDNDCSGADTYNKDPPGCSFCESLGTPCLNGGKDISRNAEECTCDCHKGFNGEYCQLTPEIAHHLENAAMIQIHGELWNSKFRIPIDKYEIERKWNAEWKIKILKSLEDNCKISQCGTKRETDNVYVVQMVQDFPILHENGTITLKVYGQRNEEYVNKDILQRLFENIQ